MKVVGGSTHTDTEGQSNMVSVQLSATQCENEERVKELCSQS